jgi:3'-5' exoribonuclease
VKVQARVEVYKNRPQLSIVQVRLARPEEIDLVDYLPHTKADVEAMWAQLLGHAQSIGNPWLRQLVQSIIAEPEVARCYKRAPAAKTMHHAYIGGLLEHVVSLCGMAKVVAGHYAELDGDLLLTAAILHDVGKLEELCYERAIGYTTEGQLLGHIVMELETVLRAIDKIEGFPVALKTVVQHLLISHHGQYEFGSPKLPMIREAMVFHYLDDLDSKLAASRVALATPSGDDEWSAYSSALGRRFLKLDEFLKAKDPAASPQPPQPATPQPSAAPAAQTAISAAAQSAASQPAAANANSAAAKPSGNAASSQQPFSRPPLENSHSKPAPKPKSEQGFLRKLFS